MKKIGRQPETPAVRRAAKRYVTEMMIALAVYTGTIFISVWLTQQGGTTPLRYLWGAMPVIPVLYCVSASMRFFRQTDEMQRRIQLEGMAFSFAVTAPLTITAGFLQNAGLPTWNWIWVWPVMALFWVIGTLAAKRRYSR